MNLPSDKCMVRQLLGPGGGAVFKDGVDASGRVAKVRDNLKQSILDVSIITVHRITTFQFNQGKGVYQFANKYGANVDGYR